MYFTLIIPAAIGAAGGLISSAFGNMQRSSDYERNQKDNLRFFHIRNKYNSPENQMQLLKEAGLNPNLAYGKGFTSAGAGPLTNPDLEPGPYRNPGIDILTAIGQSQDFTVKNAQTDTLRAQADKLEQDTINQKITAIGQSIANVLSKEQLDEWLDADMKKYRKKGQIGAHREKHYGGGFARDKYETSNLEKQIFKAAETELRKYRLKLPEAEYNLLQAKIATMEASTSMQEMILTHYEALKGAGVAGMLGKVLLDALLK